MSFRGHMTVVLHDREITPSLMCLDMYTHPHSTSWSNDIYANWFPCHAFGNKSQLLIVRQAVCHPLCTYIFKHPSNKILWNNLLIKTHSQDVIEKCNLFLGKKKQNKKQELLASESAKSEALDAEAHYSHQVFISSHRSALLSTVLASLSASLTPPGGLCTSHLPRFTPLEKKTPFSCCSRKTPGRNT